jgi:hypothetical protein
MTKNLSLSYPPLASSSLAAKSYWDGYPPCFLKLFFKKHHIPSMSYRQFERLPGQVISFTVFMIPAFHRITV